MKLSPELEMIRNKILDSLVWAEPKPDSIVALAFYLVETLEESEVKAVEAVIERAQMENKPELVAWLVQLYEAAGVPVPLSEEALRAAVGG